MRDVATSSASRSGMLPVLGWLTAALFFFYAWCCASPPA
jgi:hypothetical protein